MFTGIVAARGEVLKVEGTEAHRRLWVRSPVLEDRVVGASVSVDGVCLTVVEREGDVCAFDVSAETLDRSTLGARAAGDEVNVETPLRADGELGGHIVQGHVDGVGLLVAAADEGEGRRLRVEAPPELLRYAVEKGSVTVDGIALTVTALGSGWFEVALVPHTLAVTTAGTWGPGRAVNLEADVLAKYVETLIESRSGVDRRQTSG